MKKLLVSLGAVFVLWPVGALASGDCEPEVGKPCPCEPTVSDPCPTVGN